MIHPAGYRRRITHCKNVRKRQSCRSLAILLLLFITNGANTLIAQGCSDAGFCTIGNLHQLDQATAKKHEQKISLFLPLGIGDEKVFVFAPGVQYDNRLNEQWAVQAKLTANYANGALGNVTGPGDVFLSGIYTIKNHSAWSTSVLLGTKLPLNSGNLKNGDLPLPMQYQGSLGTVDVISGLSTSNNNWQFAAGWQQPLTGSNKNQFLPGRLINDDSKNYPPSKSFNRKGDVLVRAAYTYKPVTTLSVNGGLLAIYHLGNDSYTDINNNRLTINGSSGLTLNLTLAATLKLNDRTNIGFNAGTPLIFRDVRPDGLTRKFVFAPEISWNF